MTGSRYAGGSRHFGDVLAADGEVDLDAGRNFAAGLLRQSQQYVRDALFDLLIGQLDHPGLGREDGCRRSAMRCWQGSETCQ